MGTSRTRRKKFKGKHGESVLAYFARMDQRRRNIARTLHTMILRADPSLEFGMKWGSATYWKLSNIFWIYSMNPEYINFGFFQGAKIVGHDPKHLIEGTGKGIRHIKVRLVTDINPTYFRRLIRKALSLDEKRTRASPH